MWTDYPMQTDMPCVNVCVSTVKPAISIIHDDGVMSIPDMVVQYNYKGDPLKQNSKN